MIAGERRSSFALPVVAVALFLVAGSFAILLAGDSAIAFRTASLLRLTPNDGTEPLPPGAAIETLLTGMSKPIAMAFDPDGRLFYTEKETGRVRLFANGVLQASPVITYNVDGACAERGLLGIAIDPDFENNHYVYVYYTQNPGSICGSATNRVARFVENNGAGTGSIDIFASGQTTGTHNGGNIHFGPDGKLYISVGDDTNAANAQNVISKNGKIHRINPDGTIPTDNPVFTQTGALPSLYAVGLRNTFDFTFDPVTPGRIFASENGPNCDDEMNRIEAGFNYGWRDNYPCDDTNPSPEYSTIPPLWYLPTSQCCRAPTGITVYSGAQIPQWTDQLFMATYNYGGALRHFYLDGTRTVVTQTNIVSGVSVGTDMEVGPDGALWYIEGGGYVAGTLKRIVGPPSSPTATRTPSPTFTHTATPTGTATPSGGGLLVGHVVWQGRPAQPNALQSLPMTITLHWNGGGTDFNYATFTNASGFFTISVTMLPAGSYTWRAKGPQYLTSSGNVTLNGLDIQIEMGLQLVGDANGDNCVSIADFNVLVSAFGRSLGDPDYDARTDFNGDSAVGITDFSLLKTNFAICGAP